MGTHTDAFFKELNNAVLPDLPWTKKDQHSFWSLPISQWSDYFTLRKAKRLMMEMFTKQQVIVKMPQIVPLYIKAIQKGNVLTMDYLQNYGDLVLKHLVEKHFSKKYGIDSKEWLSFSEKEMALWQKVLTLRKKRKENFIKQKIMDFDSIPKEVRLKLIQKSKISRLKQSLESYSHYQDGEDRRGRKMPQGIRPAETSLVILQKLSNKK